MRKHAEICCVPWQYCSEHRGMVTLLTEVADLLVEAEEAIRNLTIGMQERRREPRLREDMLQTAKLLREISE